VTQAAGDDAPSVPPPTLDPEVARRVATLVLAARRAVEGLASGQHKSPHRGASVVFVEHREYRPGDDPRLLDWRAYARTDRHTIKRFEQETQLRATLALDRSGSMAYPTQPGAYTKAAHAATLLAALAYVLVRQGDLAGAVTFAEAPGTPLPARSRPGQVEAIVGALAAPPEAGATTDLAGALSALAERAGRRGFVAVASDLLDLREGALDPLAQLAARGHDVVVFHVLHPDELTLPFDEPTRFDGLEGEDAIDADPTALRERYQQEIARFLDACRARCTAAGARYVLARTDVPPEHTLAETLRARGRRGWA
jgi:uncharacterized protein (DUF58 family)